MIPIDEGPAFHVGTVTMENGLEIPTGLVRGELFVRSRVSAATQAIEARLGWGANVWPNSHIDRDARRVDLIYHIEWRWPWSALHWLRLL